MITRASWFGFRQDALPTSTLGDTGALADSAFMIEIEAVAVND
ncbi:MAG: hypothetical protein AB8C46_10175 [Burkholderiaceae bacterium]